MMKTKEEVFQDKLKSAYVFRHRWLVTFAGRNISSLASGDDEDEAILDAIRAYRGIGMELTAADATVTLMG